MDLNIALILTQDGITNAAIYALLAMALVLVFAVTRVVFIQQGEFVAYGALTMAMIEAGRVPATLWMLLVMGRGSYCCSCRAGNPCWSDPKRPFRWPLECAVSRCGRCVVALAAAG